MSRIPRTTRADPGPAVGRAKTVRPRDRSFSSSSSIPKPAARDRWSIWEDWGRRAARKGMPGTAPTPPSLPASRSSSTSGTRPLPRRTPPGRRSRHAWKAVRSWAPTPRSLSATASSAGAPGDRAGPGAPPVRGEFLCGPEPPRSVTSREPKGRPDADSGYGQATAGTRSSPDDRLPYDPLPHPCFCARDR